MRCPGSRPAGQAAAEEDGEDVVPRWAEVTGDDLHEMNGHGDAGDEQDEKWLALTAARIGTQR